MSSSYVRIANDAAGKDLAVYPHGTVWQQGVVSTEWEHQEIHEGDSFSFQEVITLGSAATQDYLLTVPDTTTWPHFGWIIEGTFGITVELFEGTTHSGGVAQTAYDRNRNTANTPGMTIHKGPSGGADGTKIAWRKSGSGTSTGKLSGTSSEALERVLKQNTAYLLRVTSAAASNDINVTFDWYEHANP